MTHRRIKSTTTGPDGEPIRYQDHELPHQDLDPLRPSHGDPMAVARAWSEDIWQEQHGVCEAPWVCLGCERNVCPRCEPSPAEQELCPECWWQTDPGDAA